jgi:23S rRNA pseudouridine2605 synthase
MAEQRLQKILSQAGVASRRKSEELITEGRVTVNGNVVTELGSKADFDVDHVKVDGRLLRAPKNHIYLAMNKPKGCVTTVSDPEGRETVMHMLKSVRERVFPVGRLDYQSEGLLLFTNDGDFAHKLTSPASHVTKTYVVKVNGQMTDEQERSFREGVLVHGRRTSPAEIKCVKQGVNPWYEVKITEGRQNQIRLMFAYFGKLVEKLRRVKIAFLELDVPPAQYRPLTTQEVEHFKKLLSAKPAPKPIAAPKAKGAPKPERAKFPPKSVSKFQSKSKAKFPPKRVSRFKSESKFSPRPKGDGPAPSSFSPKRNTSGPSRFSPKKRPHGKHS